MLTNTNIAFIGGGMMGEAIIAGLLKAGASNNGQIAVSDPVETRRTVLREKYGVRVTASNAEAVKEAQIVILAVKPQMMGAALGEFRNALSPDTLVLSIAAGTSIATIREGLNPNQPMVRVMPNTPAAVGMAMSVWTKTDNVTPQQAEWTMDILRAIGEEVAVPSEHYVDMGTAVNGSGPGFVFLFIEAMIDAAVQLGLARTTAEKLVIQTVRGSAEMAAQSGQHPAILKNQVTSPGGTTAAGLYALEAGALRATIANAVRAAYERSVQLGK